jgi:hypothetical protein
MSTASEPSQPICPKCHSDFVKRSRRAGLIDHVISSFSIYPFRCQLCSYRFHRFQKGVTYKRIYEDRRDYERLPVNLTATFTIGAVRGHGLVTDISMAGCSLDTETRLGIGDILHMQLQLPNQTNAVDVEAAILRSIYYNRASLEFLRFKSGDKERLQDFIREVISSGSFRKA